MLILRSPSQFTGKQVESMESVKSIWAEVVAASAEVCKKRKTANATHVVQGNKDTGNAVQLEAQVKNVELNQCTQKQTQQTTDKDPRHQGNKEILRRNNESR
ncbi:hypothetical protein HAX54_042601 [Datura stramonium]|uniref:Uncharacterized protein n=1 Tax=Datura stramonium TaxID=4076 RepID=A0ABS8RNS9_DATST|nr:hypothetical protein [Datura stramonium]